MGAIGSNHLLYAKCLIKPNQPLSLLFIIKLYQKWSYFMTVRAGIAGIGRWGQVLINSVSNSKAINFTVGCTGRKALARDYCKKTK